jgi:hypothetical protein
MWAGKGLSHPGGFRAPERACSQDRIGIQQIFTWFTGPSFALGDGPGRVDEPDMAERLLEVAEELAG